MGANLQATWPTIVGSKKISMMRWALQFRALFFYETNLLVVPGIKMKVRFEASTATRRTTPRWDGTRRRPTSSLGVDVDVLAHVCAHTPTHTHAPTPTPTYAPTHTPTHSHTLLWPPELNSNLSFWALPVGWGYDVDGGDGGNGDGDSAVRETAGCLNSPKVNVWSFFFAFFPLTRFSSFHLNNKRLFFLPQRDFFFDRCDLWLKIFSPGWLQLLFCRLQNIMNCPNSEIQT